MANTKSTKRKNRRIIKKATAPRKTGSKSMSTPQKSKKSGHIKITAKEKASHPKIFSTLFRRLFSFKRKPQKKPVTKTTREIRVIRLKKVIFFSVLIGTFLWIFWGIPLPTKLTKNEFPVSTKLYDRYGNLLFEIYADRRSTPITLQEIPDNVINATLSIEDKDFYKHYGVSITGLGRAAYKTIFKNKLEGGSTLTQQLVKNSLLTPERTLRRKIRELALTFIVETIYSKDQILEIYLNQIPYGSTAYGIEASAELYFNKSAKDLTLAEAALLAGLPAAPTRFSPFGAHPELASQRQELVLKRMYEDGHISESDMNKALNEDLHFADIHVPTAPHFSLWIKDQLAEKYGDAVVERGGLRVTTTLDLELQEYAQQAVATEVAKLKNNNVGNGAAIVTKPSTGEILAMVGSKDYFASDEDGKVNIIFRERQPGSSIKPLNYALAISDERISASTPLADVPTCFSVVGQASYCPKNYDNTFHGIPQVRYSLANSYNVPAVRVLAVNGLENFIEFASNMGISTWDDPNKYGLSLTLGGGEVLPFDMAKAFGVFANRGIKQELYAISKVENYKGELLYEVNPDEFDKGRVIDQGVAFIISHILQDNGARSAAFGSSSLLNVKGFPKVSVKTGTTNDLRDNWTVGYTGDAVVVVWVGNNDNSPMSRATSGVSGASPIWNSIMGKVLEFSTKEKYGQSNYESHLIQPDSVIGATVCSDNGNLAGDSPTCPTRYEYFLKDFVGSHLEWGQTDIAIDKATGQQADPKAPPESIETQNHPFVLDPLGTLYCLNCPIASFSAAINYPVFKKS
ncbi:penicillin-binding protein [Candidatus Woesebacteria bacterium]|nr:MAG: penicillin-binding protein [Candidatus Woesebacteria bacterium]